MGRSMQQASLVQLGHQQCWLEVARHAEQLLQLVRALDDVRPRGVLPAAARASSAAVGSGVEGRRDDNCANHGYVHGAHAKLQKERVACLFQRELSKNKNN